MNASSHCRNELLLSKHGLARHQEMGIDLGSQRRDAVQKFQEVLVEAQLDDFVSPAVAKLGAQLAGDAFDLPRAVVAQHPQRFVNEVHARMQ